MSPQGDSPDSPEAHRQAEISSYKERLEALSEVNESLVSQELTIKSEIGDEKLEAYKSLVRSFIDDFNQDKTDAIGQDLTSLVLNFSDTLSSVQLSQLPAWIEATKTTEAESILQDEKSIRELLKIQLIKRATYQANDQEKIKIFEKRTEKELLDLLEEELETHQMLNEETGGDYTATIEEIAESAWGVDIHKSKISIGMKIALDDIKNNNPWIGES